MKKWNNKRGFTFIEVFLSITLFSIIMGAFLTHFLFFVKTCSKDTKILGITQELRCASNYIENTIRMCNYKKIIYNDKQKRFTGEDRNANKVYIDLSGKIQYEQNTLIYFYEDKRELRINKRGEHNILVEHIKEITVSEIIENKLIEIEVFGDQEKSVKTTIKIN
ncbi:prepilin-type N-terminal cleavage/methylation domain-containing protein [Marinisporobacter balticus]|uniref:Pilin/secretion family protein with methylation motif n=1 Tax=Marinisporobacter balticus TaxID=2018667 RepID=A0A4R2L8X7_9FIRM|nr:prepilin-type N-terminal cleavage/methylation domain-containing protein [Marinisporobacter balticus]TCO79178.1 pilin/secretion family protein with methylation motif [Marinisporobacter balticus]